MVVGKKKEQRVKARYPKGVKDKRKMRLLVKFPTRSRRQKFIGVVKGYLENSNTPDNIEFVVSIDSDDVSMLGIEEHLKEYNNVFIHSGVSLNKINAVNRDIDKALSDWDILVLASDDMICQVKGWDDILVSEMQEHFPDTDGILWHNDGYVQERLNTMCILGKKYYDRFGYIYHPDYASLWADNEFMEVGNKLGKQKYFPQVLFKHEHPSHTGVGGDAQYAHTESFNWVDGGVYQRRKGMNFGL